MRASLRGVTVDLYVEPLRGKFPDAVRKFTVPIPPSLNPAVSYISSVTLAVAPSGTGEMQVSGLTVFNSDFSYVASGGQPGRDYTIKTVFVTLDGQIFEFVFTQEITPIFDTDQPQAIPSSGFGTPIAWSYAPMVDLTDVQNSGYISLIAGF